MKRFYYFIFSIGILFCSFPLTISSVPAYPYKIMVETQSGKLVPIYLKGDERCRFGTSEDGYTLIQKNEGWFYAMHNENNDVIASQYALEPYDAESEELKHFKDSIPHNILPSLSKNETVTVRRSSSAKPTMSSSSLIGEKRALVILMEFRDASMKFGKENFELLFNQIGYSEDGAKGSVRDYFDFASNGQLDYQTDLYGPYITQRDMNFYGGNDLHGNDSNPQQMAIEALRSLPEDIDLSIYDNNNDGKVDNVHIIYAGYGEEAGGRANTIWAHEYPYELPITVNGMRFASYSCSPELRSNVGGKITRIGVICHELGHSLGAMDYYDTDYETGGSFEGTGCWDLMGSGSWNDDGVSPAKPNPYVRAYDYGWVSVVSPNESGTYTVDDNTVVRLETGSSNDYYLLEYRQQDEFDSYIPNDGMMIYHHHPKCEDWAKNFNSINQSHPQGFYPVYASSTKDTPVQTRDYGKINTSGCVFSAATKTAFSSTTVPAAFAWDGTSVPFAISNIAKKGSGTMSFNLVLNGEWNGGEEETDNVAYHESFENGINDFTENKMYGTTGWKVYPGNGFTMEASLIPEPFEGKRLLQLFTGYKGTRIASELISPQLTLSSDSTYIFSCMYRSCQAPGSRAPQLTINLIVNDSTDIYTMEQIDEASEWTKLSFELPKQIEKLQLAFNGLVFTGGIFLDDVKLIAEPLVSSIQNTHDSDDLQLYAHENYIVFNTQVATKCSIYSINGTLICSDISIMPGRTIKHLPPGVYIIYTEKGTRKVVVI